MSIRKLSTIFGMTVLSTLVVLANAQIGEQAARENASSTVRSELYSKLDFKPGRFLGVQRDEGLEQSLALAGGRAGLFIYKVSPTGYEIRENTAVYHTWPDFDVVFIVGVNPADGSTYRIHGFGLAQSLAEFQKLMMELKVRGFSPDQAEALAEFYRAVNPENMPLTPISSLIELKQAAERQCQSGVKSFDAGEKAFTAWWKRAEPLYEALPFQQRAVPHCSGYLVEWIVLSSPSGENCGGAPLRATLEVSSDGRVGKVTFSPLKNR